MGLAAEMAALLPYRLRPGVYDVDSREGFALLNLYAYSPDAYGCPCGVRTFSTRKPQVILSDGTRVEYAPKVAAGAMEAGEVPNMDVLEYVAIRYTARDIIRRFKESHSQGEDRHALAVFVGPGFEELAEMWRDSHPEPLEFVPAKEGGLRVWNFLTIAPMLEEMGARMDVKVLRGRWRPAPEVVVRRRLDPAPAAR